MTDGPRYVIVANWPDEDRSRAFGPFNVDEAMQRRAELWDDHGAGTVEIVQWRDTVGEPA